MSLKRPSGTIKTIKIYTRNKYLSHLRQAKNFGDRMSTFSIITKCKEEKFTCGVKTEKSN